MADIVTAWDSSNGLGDWLLSASNSVIWTDETGRSVLDETGQPIDSIFTAGQGLLAGDDLMTSVLISIFTDAVADIDDAIPDGSNDPRGWWGGPIGSKLWLRMRSKATPTTLALVKRDLEDALAWLIGDGVAAAIDVSTTWVRSGVLGAIVQIRRNDGTRRALAFARVWENY
jgi:phage gp46-like protein